MEKVLNIFVVAFLIAATLQIAGVNILMHGFNYMKAFQYVDWNALNTATGLLPILF